jgi:hypothetical protein
MAHGLVMPLFVSFNCPHYLALALLSVAAELGKYQDQWLPV